MPEVNLKKDVFSISDEDLRIIARDNVLREQALDIFERLISKMQYEIERIEQYLNSFASRGQFLMTLAGLISIISLGFWHEGFLRYYLIWIFPYFIFSIIFFAISFSRVAVRRGNFFVFPRNTEENLLIMRAEANAVAEMGKKVYENFNKILPWYRLSFISICIFLSSFIIQFYFWIFINPLNVFYNILLNMNFLFLGGAIYLKTKQSSKAITFKSGLNSKDYDPNQNPTT